MKAGDRKEVLSRLVAAALGGYALANLCSIALYRVLPMTHDGAQQVAFLISFPVYAAAVMWVFAARTAPRAWLGLAVPALTCLLIATLGARA